MKESTKIRKARTEKIRKLHGSGEMLDMVYQVIGQGKQIMDVYTMELGKMLAEAIMEIEREERVGEAYHPRNREINRWGSQAGSIYLGDQKVAVNYPRLRGPEGELGLGSYRALKQRNGFSEELLAKVMRGVSGRKYHETVRRSAECFGVSAGSVSRHIVEATARQLSDFRERDLSDFSAFAIFLDTIHRGGEAFIVALGIDISGQKRVLGFWEGATENHEICEALFSDIESRGIKLSNEALYISDGGSGIRKALKDRFGKKLLHQRCTIHKDRNIQNHLPKRYRKEAHRRFRNALELTAYEDARKELLGFEKWLRTINESAADSLNEALEEILTIHRIKVPALLRKTLHSTNPIESIFSSVRHCEHNVKRYRNSKMAQRWLAAVFLYVEKNCFRRIKGHKLINRVCNFVKQDHQRMDQAA